MDIFGDIGGRTNGVVIHHWDTDGLVSAALLRNYFQQHYPEKKLALFTPIITNYYLTSDQYDYLQQQGYEFIITCDLNFPSTTVQNLAQRWPGQVYFFDHHHHPAPHDNVHYYNAEHPACASHIAERLHLPYDILPVIAMVGDREDGIQQDKLYYPYVQAVLGEYNLTFGQLLEARRLIDSNYIADDYTGITETVQLLQDDPMSIFSDLRLKDNLTKIDEEMTRLIVLSGQELSAGVMYWEINTHFNLLSHITRALSRQYPDKIIVTRQLKNNQHNCYVRSRLNNFDARPLIALAHELGLNSGGKPEVAGIIIPPEQLDTVFPKIQSYLVSTYGQPH
ncbi:MAG: DHH family phosphoesterase [Patescibacteria group bacterium]|jgi:single-stranded DNA-specific DHH superfamily exonuclease